MNYDEVFTYENLFEAHMNARKCKRGKKDVIEFENNLSFKRSHIQSSKKCS